MTTFDPTSPGVQAGAAAAEVIASSVGGPYGAAAAALIGEGLSFWTTQAMKAAKGTTTFQDLISMNSLLNTDYSKLVADAAAKGITV